MSSLLSVASFGARGVEISLYRRERGAAEGDDALFGAFAVEEDEREVGLDVGHLDVRHLRHARPCRVEKLQHRPVAHRKRVAALGRGEELCDLGDGEEIRQALPDLGAFERGIERVRREPLAGEVPVKHPHRHERSGDGGHFEAAALLRAQE